ncbi:hypothetical protein LQZ19_02445 [Treponema primitia]|uniref:hypothetical protein n=1 Tax=Treponema primitia TaxID=88058 RepID=UPI003981056A
MKRLQQGALILCAVVLGLVVSSCGNKGKPMSTQMESGQMKDSGEKMAESTTQQSGGGHGEGMAKEDPVPFVRDMEKAALDILSHVKAGRVMDAQNSVSQLSGATDKVLPHITDTNLKDRLSKSVAEIKASVAGSPDVFELEEKIQVLQGDLKQALEKLQSMNG